MQKQSPQSRKGYVTYVVIVGAALVIMGLNIVQTWPNNAIGYGLGVSHPFSSDAPTVTIHAQLFTGNGQSVLGRPSLSPTFINRVLLAARSPAQGTGQSLYDLSKQSGIDDAYALAFFKHESEYGTTGVARQTLSLGNIRCSVGYQCVQGYRAYSSWQAGYADWYHLLAALYIDTWHLMTVEQIVPVYAPASNGNDVNGYIAAVEQSVAAWRQGEALV